MSEDLSATAKACLHVMSRIIRDPRITYFMGPGSEVWEQVTTAVAEIRGEPVEAYRASIIPHLSTVRMVEVEA